MFKDLTLGTGRCVRYEVGNLASLVAACREIAEDIGPHAVATVVFNNETSNAPDAAVVFEAAPPMAHAEDVWLFNSDARAIGQNSVACMSKFAGMKSLHPWLDNDAFRQLDWKLLRVQRAPELPKFTMTIHLSIPHPTAEIESFVEELVRSYVALPPLGEEAPDLTLDFMENYFSEALGLRIIELLRNSGRDVTFMMRTTGDGRELIQDESDYTVEVDGATTRHTSKEHAIVVELQDWIVIKSTAEVPRKKRRI